MTGLAVAEKQEISTSAPIKLETLGRGLGDINSEYKLSEIIPFIKRLNATTSVLTSQSEKEIAIPFHTPTLFKASEFKKLNSIIFITGPLKKREPEFRARKVRQVWRPTDLLIIISLNNNKEKGASEVEEITLNTKLSESEVRKIAGYNIPKNWIFK
jgi:hypothetical protein